MSKLKDFLKELGADAELRESYLQDPDGTMEKFGLTKEEIDAVCTLDMDKIKMLLGEDCDYIAIIHPHKHEHGF